MRRMKGNLMCINSTRFFCKCLQNKIRNYDNPQERVITCLVNHHENITHKFFGILRKKSLNHKKQKATNFLLYSGLLRKNHKFDKKTLFSLYSLEKLMGLGICNFSKIFIIQHNSNLNKVNIVVCGWSQTPSSPH